MGAADSSVEKAKKGEARIDRTATMGGSESKERALFIYIAKHLLTKKGTHVETVQLK